MKKTFLLSAALVALLAGPALAQDRGDRGDRGNRGERPPAAAPAAPAPAAPAPAPQGRRGGGPPAQAAPAPQAQQAQRGNDNRSNFNRGNDNGGNNGRDFGRNNNNGSNSNRGNDNRGGFNNNNANNRPGFNNNGNNRPGFNNNNRARPNPNYAQYNRAFNSPQRYRYRGPTYRQPPGFYYRRWSYGDFLPGLFWATDYWINDFRYYDLMPPPAGTVWVRYGSDALLIDRYTGEVIQVEYSVFY